MIGVVMIVAGTMLMLPLRPRPVIDLSQAGEVLREAYQAGTPVPAELRRLAREIAGPLHVVAGGRVSPK